MSEPLTTDELMREETDRTGIPLEQLALIVAKSGLIRHLARDPETRDRFIVKGGTLLYHCYKGPRASFRDVDFAYPTAERLADSASPEQIEQMRAHVLEDMRVAGPDFHVHVHEDQWRMDNAEIGELKEVPFTIAGLQAGESEGRMKLTVSIRASERMHDPEELIEYEDRMLASSSTFGVQGLCVEELAAEKVLGWGLKELRKHYVDLAVIGRRYSGLDGDLVVDLVQRKIAVERNQAATRDLYRSRGVKKSSDLVKLIRAPHAGGLMHQKRYEEVLGTEVVLSDEEERAEPDFDDAKQVVAAFGFWEDVLNALSR